ncbi:hypothetical protein D9619_007593 [Psilocybe cf. subviscida]|uniref:High nitrogen upregulated cytochrome P450 monooxygenase 2 n=1 Tax=Psilocybe cf. subviscida TaxID=2480587 RepID=A0A8H5EX05_9AGAR|nr:hypothetical protein D9619_007593 [Psilocybe cf. subviscida]
MNTDLQAWMLTSIVVALAAHQWLKRCDPVALPKAVAVLTVVPALPILFSPNQLSTVFPTAISTYGIFYLTLALSITAYRVSPYHPLAKYPGPRIMKITKLWGAYIAYKGQSHVYLKAMHDKYGPTIRIGPNEISTIERSLLPQIFGSQGMLKGPMWTGRKLPKTKAQQESGLEVLIELQEPSLHAQLRKPWNKGFTAEPLKSYEFALIRRIRQINTQLRLVTELSLDGVGQVDVSKWICYFAFDFIGDIAFGGGFNLMKEGDKHGTFHSMEKALVLPAILQHIPWASEFVRSLPTMGTDLSKFIGFAMEHAVRRFQMDVKEKDLFYYMSEASGSNLESDLPVIISNALLAIIAGSDTSSVTLSCVVQLLLANPTAFARLQQEVDQTFDEHDIPSFDVDLDPEDEAGETRYNEVFAVMPYLNAVLNEGLRLFPAVATGLQRAPANGSGGKHLVTPSGNFYLPEGNAVTVPAYVMHRDPAYFSPSPDAFIPERWLPSSERSDEKRAITAFTTSRDAFLPFSMGQQNCVGRPLALMEMRYLLATLVRNFDIKFDDSKVGMQQWTDGLEDRYTFQPKGILPVRISRREIH